MLAWIAVFASIDAATGAWFFLGNLACLAAMYWRWLHCPPLYYDQRAFRLWLPPAVILFVLGLIT